MGEDGQKQATNRAARKASILRKYMTKKAVPVMHDNKFPQKLWVTVLDTAVKGEHLANPARRVSGLYMLVQGTKVEGMPLWEQVGGEGRIESTTKGHWMVTDTGIPKLLSLQKHEGRNPTEVGVYRSRSFEGMRARELDEALENGEGLWTNTVKGENGVDGDACVTANEAKVHGFRYGRAVVSNMEIIDERGNILVPMGCLGIVLGPGSSPFTVRVKYDTVLKPIDVPNQEIDLAEGPSVTVSRPNGITQIASIINVTDTRVKLHFQGRLKTEDEWFDKDSKRIMPYFTDNPEGLMDAQTDSEGISTAGSVNFGEGAPQPNATLGGTMSLVGSLTLSPL
eukprot:TRINITY_DN29905_c0_g1_i1.p1 TRINITY_DN29905_c0_g1~~TRINITY_DN29905_c0_g1_i1.p1  ORF type:complete len:377 (+),score=115.09 TRINITY_DN29905_c0_g1_i1:115-1131(+)